jgi:hypothetical protein
VTAGIYSSMTVVIFRDLRTQVVDMIRKFTHDHGRPPTKVHFTRAHELALLTVDSALVGGEIAGKLMTDGPRVAFARFLGLEAVWDADELKLE